ncbi:hypothetical protein L6452_44275 [Arctium lappa]|uniref:Uncharacterized protein n=1 Tax=Arctium lappa TaxID=4217 RepID=A0ACB8XFE7_ARCLA|nr:hypothetical protein L6452_44275 [Arctium lappa]
MPSTSNFEIGLNEIGLSAPSRHDHSRGFITISRIPNLSFLGLIIHSILCTTIEESKSILTVKERGERLIFWFN